MSIDGGDGAPSRGVPSPSFRLEEGLYSAVQHIAAASAQPVSRYSHSAL